MSIEPPSDASAAALNAWAAARQAEGDLQGAILGFSGAVAAGVEELGKDHPAVAILLNNLANVQREAGNHAAALEEYQTAERIDRAAYGPLHPKVGDRVYRIGMVEAEMGRLDAARVRFEEAFTILAQTRGIGGEDTMEVALALLGAGGDPVGFARSKGAPEGVLNAIVAELRRVATERGP